MANLAEFLSHQLTEDLKWREEELAVMRKQLYLAKEGGLQERVLLRAGVAMLYAHYEGYCKFAIELYLDSLRKLKLPRKEFVWKLAAYSMESFRNELGQVNSSAEFFSELLGRFNQCLDEEAGFELTPSTSNLWPDLLIKWLDDLNLGAGAVQAEETLLSSLVRNRNQIAHGKRLVVKDRKALDAYAHAALVAMHEVAVGIVTALESKSYLRSKAVTTVINHAV